MKILPVNYNPYNNIKFSGFYKSPFSFTEPTGDNFVKQKNIEKSNEISAFMKKLYKENKSFDYIGQQYYESVWKYLKVGKRKKYSGSVKFDWGRQKVKFIDYDPDTEEMKIYHYSLKNNPLRPDEIIKIAPDKGDGILEYSVQVAFDDIECTLDLLDATVIKCTYEHDNGLIEVYMPDGKNAFRYSSTYDTYEFSGGTKVVYDKKNPIRTHYEKVDANGDSTIYLFDQKTGLWEKHKDIGQTQLGQIIHFKKNNKSSK